MAQNEYNHAVMPENRTILNLPNNPASTLSTDEEILADVDEPPDLGLTFRSSDLILKLHNSLKAPFSKEKPRCERRESLLTSALHSTYTSPTEESMNKSVLNTRTTYDTSTWSNNSASTAELTSDGSFTGPGTRTSTPSPPLPSSTFHSMAPIFGRKPLGQPVSIQREAGTVGSMQPVSSAESGEQAVEANLGRKRCISFACGRKEVPKPAPEATKPVNSAQPEPEPTKRVCTIKFACPSKISTEGPSHEKSRIPRAASPAPLALRIRAASKAHRDSDSTVRNPSPINIRKKPVPDRVRRLSVNSDLARCEAFRFHEFASSEEEVDEWLQESTCHRSRLTIHDTLKIENGLRQLGEEAEEEALDDEEEEEEHLDEAEDEDDEYDDILGGDGTAYGDVSDEGFQTDDEEGFAGSDNDSDAGSDCDWWRPGAYSTAATSTEHLEHIRPSVRRSVSESSIGSLDSNQGFKMPEKPLKRKKSRPVNIRVPSPELPDSTDFVCGTLDEDRPLEAAYMSCLERRRAAKHKMTPQDIDPTFPTSDPEMEEEDEDNNVVDLPVSESDGPMLHGPMDPPDFEPRGRNMGVSKKRSPLQSPKRPRSPAPAKRVVHRLPPSRKLFGQSPRRLRSPAPTRLRSPPPTRRGSSVMSPEPPEYLVRFGGLAQRPALTMCSSLPRTPIAAHSPEYDEGDSCGELPVRRAIDIKIGLEKKRQRRREQLYRNKLRKGAKDKRPPPGKGLERMREMGLGLAAHKGKSTRSAFDLPPTPDERNMHVLSV